MLRNLLVGIVLFGGFVATTYTHAAFDSSQFNANKQPLQLLRITPDGEDVPASRQLVFQFNRPVVPVGRMERTPEEIPISITPTLQCEWRWLNTSSLACQLTKANQMNVATRYRVRVSPGIRTEDGSQLEKVVTHEFITQRPKIRRTRFKTWKSAGLPHILVIFDQPVDGDSVAEHLYLTTEDGRRVALEVMEDPDVVKAYERKKNNQTRRDPDPGLTEFALESGRQLTAWVMGEKDEDRIEFVQRSWIVYPKEELPLDHRIQLHVSPGIKSMKGPEPGIEERVALTFDTFPAFRFLGIRCSNNDNKQVTIAPDDEAGDRLCNPLKQKYLLFSSPVIKEVAREGLRFTPDLAGGRTDFDPWASAYSWSRLTQPHRKGREYPLAIPVSLKAAQSYRLQSVPEKLKDEFGRSLPEPIEMGFATDHRLPEFALKHQVSVLEQNVDTHLPVVVTNLKEIRLKHETVTAGGKERGDTRIPVGRAEDIAYHFPLKIREIVPSTSGAIQGVWETTPPIKQRRYWDLPNWFFSQVTPYNVHVKMGHHSSLVWVTRFDNGLPVKDAKVEIYIDELGRFADNPEVVQTVTTGKDGVAVFDGTTRLDPQLRVLNNYRRKAKHFFVRITKGRDFALVPLVRDFAVRPSIVSNRYASAQSRKRFGHIRTWGFTAQGVYKAGDEIDFKFYVRDQSNRQFVPAPRLGYTLKVYDPTNKVIHEVKDLSLNQVGAYHGKFTVAKNGAVGWYRFSLSASFTRQKWTPLKVLVSDFTPAAFRVTTDLNGKLFKPGDSLVVTTLARLHAGGPYADAEARVTARVRGTPLRPSDPGARGFQFDVLTRGRSVQQTLHQGRGRVNDKGELATEFKVTEARALYGQLQVESAVRDDRGKFIARSANATYVGRDRYVGIKQPDWLLQAGKPAVIKTVVVNSRGRIVADTRVDVKIRHRITRAARVKGAGNAYLTRYTHEWKDVAQCAHPVQANSPVHSCRFTPAGPGYFEMTATIEDKHGRKHQSRISRWAIGKGQVLWETPPGNVLPIVPEKNVYKVGETARFLVKNPYPGARALVTIERFGISRKWTMTLKNSTEVIEVPIRPHHLPGFYLSVVVTSPRVTPPPGNHQVDLGKPAFRMGYVKVPVKDPFKELAITVTPRQQSVKPRSKVTVDLKVRTHQGAVKPTELAVVALDEAVFDLIAAGKAYYDPYEGFYKLDPLDMSNFSLLTRLIGIQKFEKKGANAGGDGGPDLALRSVFKYIGYWNPSLKPDAQGKATISFEVPDNLTGWRVMAIGVTRQDYMGLGEGSFKVNQPTEIRPSLPNQVTEGDRFDARFTVMNRTNKTRTLKLSIAASGAVSGTLPGARQFEFTAEPYKRYTFGLPVKAGPAGKIDFTVRAGDALDRDALKVPMPVYRQQALETAATYGTTTSASVSERIKYPKGIRTDVGRLSVTASPTVIGGLEGAFEYLRDYPYICWEQTLTKGVMASHYLNLRSHLQKSLTWKGADKLPETTLARAVNYQAPNGGMTYYIPRNKYADPYLSVYTAIAFNWLRESGYAIPSEVENKLHEYLLNMLRRDVFPDFYSKGMSSTVRAVALAALSAHGKVTRDDLDRYRQHVNEMTLFGKAHYLMAASRVGNTGEIQDQVLGLIRAHANETGGKFVFGEQVDFIYKRMLNSSLRTNCAVLSAFLANEDPKQGQRQATDVPFKLVRTITQTRKNKAHWENTQENMFCMNALIEFSRAYEKDRPDMSVHAFLDKQALGSIRFGDFRDPPRNFDKPIGPADPGRKATVRLERQGKGRLYYATRLRFSPKTLKTEPINAGIEVRRQYSVERDGRWQVLKNPMTIRQGELVRVDLYVTLPTARNFVVVDDPVPGGLEPVNRDLATASTVDADKAKYLHGEGSLWWRHDDWREYGLTFWSFYHQELRHHAARFYSQYLPQGRYHLSYVAQAIAPGEFTVMPTHVEEMYDPDVFGKGVPANLKVDPQP